MTDSKKVWACWRCNYLNDWLAVECGICGQPMRCDGALISDQSEGEMANIKKFLEEVEGLYGEQIEAVVVGPHDNRPTRWSKDDKPRPDENAILSREDGLKKLDEEYDNGYGGADCFPMYAWTKSRVFFIAEYDGATGIAWAPRHPVALEPQFSGQSPIFDAIDKMKKAV